MHGIFITHPRTSSMMAELTDATNISKVSSHPLLRIKLVRRWYPSGLCLHDHGLVHCCDSEISPLLLDTSSPQHSQLGPIIGGSLSRPAERFPRLFGNIQFFKNYPYFLPCAVSAALSAIAWVVTYLFLEETVCSPTPVAQYFGFKKENITLFTPNGIDETEDTPFTDTVSPNANNNQTINNLQGENPLPLRSILTRRVIVAAGNYTSLSLVDIAFRAIQPLFFSTPIHLGGLGLPPATIGTLLSIYGILNGLFQLFFFARINDRWGSKNTFMLGIASGIPIFASFPIINTLARHQGYSVAVWTAVGFQIVISIALSLSSGKLCVHIKFNVLNSVFH